MQEEPADLSLPVLLDALRTHWAIQPSDLVYAPVGHGSHHWIGSNRHEPRWFVTADRLARDDPNRLVDLQAGAAAAQFLAGRGHEYVIPPLSTLSGGAIQHAPPGWAVQVTPYVEGRSTDQGSWADPHEHAQIGRLIGQLHAEPPPSFLPRGEFTIPGRATIESALAELADPWTGGPYAGPARALLSASAATVTGYRQRYDSLATEIASDPQPWVLTHGEPDSDNVIRTASGSMYLIDWSTAKIAPRERDLLDVLPGAGSVSAYQETAGPNPPRAAALELACDHLTWPHFGRCSA